VLLVVGNVGTLKHEVTSCVKTEMRLKAVLTHTRARKCKIRRPRFTDPSFVLVENA